MGWIRDIFTGGESERAAQDRYPGPRDGEFWDEDARQAGEGRDGQEWRSAGRAFEAKPTRMWSDPARASIEHGRYDAPRSSSTEPTWGSEGGGGWYQGWRGPEREEGTTHGRRDPSEGAHVQPQQFRTGFNESPVGGQAAYSYGVGNLFPSIRQPYGGASWTPESSGGYSVGEQIYGRSVVKPDGWEQAQRRERRGPTAKGWRRADERIRDAVSDELMEHPAIDASEIDVEVAEARVTLRGTVEDRREKYRIEDVVENVFGVEEVDNQIRVQRRAGRSEHDPYSVSAKRIPDRQE